MKKLFLLLLVGVTSGLIAQQQELATILELSGAVYVRSTEDTDWQRAEAGMSLFSGDIVKTGANSSVEIMTEDETSFSLEENSEFVVGEKQQAFERWYLNLGKLLVNVRKKLSPERQFEVKTPVAVCAVRGTEFAVETTADDTNIGVLEGKVYANSIVTPQPEAVIIAVNQEIVIPRKVAGLLRPVPLGVRWAWANRRRAYVLKRLAHWRKFLRQLPPEKRILIRQRIIGKIQRIKERHKLQPHPLHPGRRR